MASWVFDALNAVIDLMFLIDIIISFRTTFVNQKTGDEISDTHLVARHYLRMLSRINSKDGRFWIDLLATIPFDSIAEVSTFMFAKALS